MEARKIIDQVIALDTQIAQLRDRFDELPEDVRAKALTTFYEGARAEVGADDPVSLALVRATDMICALDDAAAAILAKGLDHPSVDVRQLTGEALLSLAEDGVEIITPAIEHALKAGCPAAEEMPFILAMVDDPAAPEHITRFLDLDQLDAVVAGIEALAEARDPGTIPALQSLTKDPRKVEVDAGDGTVEKITVGKLAVEAIELIEAEVE